MTKLEYLVRIWEQTAKIYRADAAAAGEWPTHVRAFTATASAYEDCARELREALDAGEAK